MRIAVSLDTQAALIQPSPARAKAGGFVPVEITFTRNNQPVMLATGATLEFVLKPRNTWTGGMLVYHAAFAAGAGNVYAGVANFATQALLTSLGLADTAPANDIPQIETAGEVVWSVGGQRFRSATFTVTVEAPLLDTNLVPPADPALYPTPAELQALFDAKVSATPPNANFRFKDGVTLQLWNETTAKWHTLFLTGADGVTQLVWSEAGES